MNNSNNDDSNDDNITFCHLPPSSKWQSVWKSVAWYGRELVAGAGCD